MSFVEVRGVRIGEGIPKVCVPVFGREKEAVLSAARAARVAEPDLAEWRVDYLEEVFLQNAELNRALLAELFHGIRGVLGEIPLLFTFRTKAEGGEQAASEEQYFALNRFAAECGETDLLDLELLRGDGLLCGLISIAHANGVKVIVSNHDFEKTPPDEVMRERLCHMDALGADLAKLAVMPQSAADVLRLMSVTLKCGAGENERGKEQVQKEIQNDMHCSCPIISMSMGQLGLLSRLSGELTGSALSFGTAGMASAPGQIDAGALRTMLRLMHESGKS